MPSSTSSSEPKLPFLASPGRASVVLLAGALLLLVAAEIGTHTFMYGFSNMLSRLRRESREAAHLGPAAALPPPVLLVGNSLLVAGVDVAALDAALRPDHRVARFAIEQTTYYDWYFGLRRLMNEGSRPEAVVLCFEPRHLLGHGIHDEIFGHYNMQLRDIFRVAGAVGLSPTETSELFFANVSEFWSLRREARKNLLGRLMPSFPLLAAMMTRSAPPARPSLSELSDTGARRMVALRQEVEPHGVRFVLALMPPLQREQAEVIRKLGADNDVVVLAPVTDTDLQRSDYDRDGYHLSAQGRDKYTAALARDLGTALRGRTVPPR